MSPAPPQATPTAAVSASFGFVYDATNRRISQTATDNSWWNYPPAATSVAYTANNLNQYTAVGSASPTYDGNGNLTFDGSLTYGYDAESRLVSVSGAGLAATFAYDAQGRRKSQTVNGTTTILATEASNRVVLDYDGTSGATENWYVYGLGPNDLLNQINVQTATRATAIPDILGSVIGALDATSGTLGKAGFQTYGESTAAPVSTFGYTGQRVAVAGLYDYRARMYSPVLGRFLQADPAAYSAGSNLYAYVGNDPPNLVDALGLSADVPASYPTSNQMLGDFAIGIGKGVLQSVANAAWFVTGLIGCQGDSGCLTAPTPQLFGPPASISEAEGRVIGPLTTLAFGSGVSEGGESGAWHSVNESMSARAAAYQSQITGQAIGQAYVINGVRFDGFDSVQGLLEAKGPGYASFVAEGEFQPWFQGASDLVSQAERQIAAANGTPITWHVAEPEATTAIRNLFQSNGIKGINVVSTPSTAP